MAKLLFIFLFFSFFLDLLYRRKCRKVSYHKCHGHMIGSHRVMSHDECRKTVYRLCSSYISSIKNLTGTLSSSLCQLG